MHSQKRLELGTSSYQPVMSLDSAKDPLPFIGFLTPKRDQSDRLAPMSQRSALAGCDDGTEEPLNLESRDSTGAIPVLAVVIEPGTPDSSRFPHSGRTPDSGCGQRNGSGQPHTVPQRHYSGGSEPGFETPARKLHPGRTFLQDRMFGDIFDSPGGASSEQQSSLGVDFLSPERDWGKRGRPRADEITSLIMEGSQSGSNIKCHICSRLVNGRKVRDF
jgi:hypothetical protein